MAETPASLIDEAARSHWVRLRTLIVLRWVAIAGQLAVIEIARHLLAIQIDLGLCYLAIGAAIIANLLAIFIYPENKRLSENETVLTLLFDISQLTFLLYLTGGLNNPFALLILAPVTIAATALSLRSVLMLAGTALGLITVITFAFVPLTTEDGLVIRMPDIMRFGFWAAIVIGVGFLALYTRRISREINNMSEALLATQLALAREQKLTDLGGVVAAAAHELGTPLATIKLVSAELMEELGDRQDLLEDAALIRDQADRCRDILRSMGRAGKDDLHMRRAPLDSVLHEAADPHLERGKKIHFDIDPMPDGTGRQPTILRRPEIIHGLRNLIQNAVDFSHSQVWIEGRCDEDRISVRIMDDGDGYPQEVIGRIGDPFMRSRRGNFERTKRPEYEGMGLGLFIAKTLLERSGAELTFANGTDPFLSEGERPQRGGAIVSVSWPTAAILASPVVPGQGLGDNLPIQI